MTSMAGASPDGLRERKKARTRASIREHALRLFREEGYQRTTVEKIAEAAEVSPSTFFRYFPTKEDVVLQDDMDVRMIEALEQQPPELGPVAAVRAAARQMFASYTAADMDVLRETTALTLTVPEIRARALDEFARTISAVAEALAKRADRPADDLAVRTAAGAIIGVIMAITMPWEGWSEGEPSRTRSGRSTRPWPCWRPGCRSEPELEQVGGQPLAQVVQVDVVHAAPGPRGQVQGVSGGGTHRRARAHDPHAGQGGGVPVHAAPGRHQVVRPQQGHGAQRDVVHVIRAEHLPHVAVGAVVQLDRPGGSGYRVLEPRAVSHLVGGQLVPALDPAGLPAPGKP